MTDNNKNKGVSDGERHDFEADRPAKGRTLKLAQPVGRYRDALDKLENDILKKTDGCAAAGAPDRNDWIMSCAKQAPVYDAIRRAIEQLRPLV